jgi:hypothetical protein
MASTRRQARDRQATQEPLYPSLLQVNTRVLLTELSISLGRPATLDDIPDRELDVWATSFEWIWLLSVWQTGPAGQAVARARRDWRHAFERALPDLREPDIAGSGFAISAYTVHRSLGGRAALARLRKRMRRRGLRLMLDFVPNHTALDHSWVARRADYYVPGTEGELADGPDNYVRIKRKNGELILAHGRDPFFPAWPDTLQLNYGNPRLLEAMVGELLKIAGQCDGVRCDMAMLLLPDVFERTWGIPAQPFWPTAIERARARFPDFLFMAEVYWELEWTLLQQGFDYAYDKRLYDRLRAGRAQPVRQHLEASVDYQGKLARFLENHDEQRAAATFAPGMHQAAAVIAYLSPGLRFFHHGQNEGRKIHIPPHVVRGPSETPDDTLQQFYGSLLHTLHHPSLHGSWRLLECTPAWDGNWTSNGCVAWCWEAADAQRMLIAINYADHQSQCYVRLPWAEIAGGTIALRDLLSPARYDRDGSELTARGLFLDLPPWGRHAFEIGPLS